MGILGIDLGGTKLSVALFDENGIILIKDTVTLSKRKGVEVGALIGKQILRYKELALAKNSTIRSVGICIPGIYRVKTGSVWAPNIPGWEDYPLLQEMKSVAGNIDIYIDSDRACYILGEAWVGNAQFCTDAIFLAVGTGIGAGILVNGKVLHGSNGIAGAIGWMALSRPFATEYVDSGCFESTASGTGITRLAQQFLEEESNYKGELKKLQQGQLNSHHIFNAFENNDPIAVKVMERCIETWGMAIANLISLFNPEKVILGGGVFGPALKLLPQIINEAGKWAQPISNKQVSIEGSGLGSDAGLYGAGFLALSNTKFSNNKNEVNV